MVMGSINAVLEGGGESVAGTFEHHKSRSAACINQENRTGWTIKTGLEFKSNVFGNGGEHLNRGRTLLLAVVSERWDSENTGCKHLQIVYLYLRNSSLSFSRDTVMYPTSIVRNDLLFWILVFLFFFSNLLASQNRIYTYTHEFRGIIFRFLNIY